MVTSDTTQSGSSGAAAAANRNMRPPANCPRPPMSDLSRLRAHEQSVGPHHQHQRHHAVDDEQLDLRHQMHGGGAQMPTISAPTSAPSIEPMPPMATTAKASTITSTPMPSVTAIFGAITAPPTAPSMAPMMKVTV